MSWLDSLVSDLPSLAEIDAELARRGVNGHAKHYGPGDHPSGSPQEVHGSGGGTATVDREALESHLVDYKADRSLQGPGSAPISEVIHGAEHVTYLAVPGIDRMHDLMGIQPTLETDLGEYVKARDDLFKAQPVKAVPFSKIVYTQARVNRAKVRELTTSPVRDAPVQMVKDGDRHYLVNGHHRVAASYLAEREVIQAHVLDPAKATKAVKHTPGGQDHDQAAHGNWAHGGDAGAPPEPQIYMRPEDLERQRGGWGNDPDYWVHREKRNILSAPMAKTDLPSVIYHTTTAASAIERDGLLRAAFDGGGLGGGNSMPGVSLTTSRADAELMQKEMLRRIETANLPQELTGTVIRAQLERYAREDAERGGLSPTTFQRAVDYAMQNFDANIGPSTHAFDMEKYGGYSKTDLLPPEQVASNMRGLYSSAHQQYLQMRESDAEKAFAIDWRRIKVEDQYAPWKDPLIFASGDRHARMNPKDVVILEVPRDSLPDGALIRKGSDEFLHEIRVHADIPRRKPTKAVAAGHGNSGYSAGSPPRPLPNAATINTVPAAAKHYGPGEHPGTGSSQEAHGGGGAGDELVVAGTDEAVIAGIRQAMQGLTGPEIPTEPRQPYTRQEDLVAAIPAAQKSLEEFLDRGGGLSIVLNAAPLLGEAAITTDPTSIPGTLVIIPPPKGMERSIEKVISKYGGDWSRLTDPVRATIGVDRATDIGPVVTAFKAEMARAGWSLASPGEDRISQPGPSGYRDITFKVTGPTGVVKEVQVNTKAMIKAKNGLGHKYYVEMQTIQRRVAKAGATNADRARYNELASLSQRLYQDAWRQSGGTKGAVYVWPERGGHSASGPRPPVGYPASVGGRGLEDLRGYRQGLDRTNPYLGGGSLEAHQNGLAPYLTRGLNLPFDAWWDSFPKHYGPGEHPSGSPQEVHGGGSNGASADRPSITSDNIESVRGGLSIRPGSLKHGTWDFFDQAASSGAKLVPLTDLVSTKNELKDPRYVAGQKRDPRLRAYESMQAAAAGQVPKRGPLAVTARADGKYDIVDGNATAQVLMLARWAGQVPVVVGDPKAKTLNLASLTTADIHILKRARSVYDRLHQGAV